MRHSILLLPLLWTDYHERCRGWQWGGTGFRIEEQLQF